MIEKAVRLMKAATSKTLWGNLKWSEIASGAYQTALAEGLIRVSRFDPEEDGRDGLDVSISDRIGRVIAGGEFAGAELEYPVVFALWQAARDSAERGDEALDKMLESLSAK